MSVPLVHMHMTCTCACTSHAHVQDCCGLHATNPNERSLPCNRLPPRMRFFGVASAAALATVDELLCVMAGPDGRPDVPHLRQLVADVIRLSLEEKWEWCATPPPSPLHSLPPSSPAALPPPSSSTPPPPAPLPSLKAPLWWRGRWASPLEGGSPTFAPSSSHASPLCSTPSCIPLSHRPLPTATGTRRRGTPTSTRPRAC